MEDDRGGVRCSRCGEDVTGEVRSLVHDTLWHWFDGYNPGNILGAPPPPSADEIMNQYHQGYLCRRCSRLSAGQ